MTIKQLWKYYWEALSLNPNLNNTAIEGDVSIRNLYRAWVSHQPEQNAETTFKVFFKEISMLLDNLGQPRFTFPTFMIWTTKDADIILCRTTPHRYCVMRFSHMKFSHIKLQGVNHDPHIFQPTANQT